MILSFWRALLLAGGTWAVLGQRAYAADVAFTTYAFPATGTPTSRTMPDRLAQIKNVRDFGAKGDGVTDDLAAIMAAFNWTAGVQRGTIYFPPGTYYVSAPIDISALTTFVYFLGSGGASTIIGNFADYVIKRYLLGSNAQGGGHTVEKLTIINQHALGGGIRMGVCVGARIIDCDITANFGIDTDNSDVFGPPGDPGAYWGSLEVDVFNCRLQAYNALASSSTGIARISDGATINCTFKNFDTAIRTYGGQGAMVFGGCYFETNNIGLANSTGPGTAVLNGSSVGTVQVLGCYFKNNGIAIAYVAGIARYAGVLIEATEGTIAGNPQYGIYLASGGSSAFEGITINGQYQVAGVHMTGGEATSSESFWAGVSVVNTSTLGGVAWQLPSTAVSMNIMECNVASVWTMAKLPAKIYTIATATWVGGVATITVAGGPGDLPSGQLANVTIAGVTPSGYNGTFQNAIVTNFFTFTYTVADPGGAGSVFGTAFFVTVSDAHKANVYEGYCYDVSDANTATWGAAVTAGGGANHVKLRYTPAAWTVVGK